MTVKKEIVTDENFEELLLKSLDEALEYVRGERTLRTHFATSSDGSKDAQEQE